MLAALVGLLGDVDLAEEAAQEAFSIAAARWPDGHPPDNPRAWLVTTARNRAIDRVRRDRTLAAKTQLLQTEAREDPMEPTTFPDERLELIFTCCHPSLAIDAQVALTLRTLGGLTTDEIARAFLVPETTMAQRLVRAKRKIKAAGTVPFPSPSGASLARQAGCGTGRRLPDFQRRLRRSNWADSRGALAWPCSRIADARRARGPRTPGDDVASRLTPRGTTG